MTKKEFNTVLNECLDNLISGKTEIQDCISRYPEQADELRALLVIAQSLVTTQPVPELVAKARTRQRFLAAAMSKRNSPQPRFSFSLFRPILAGTATTLAVFSLFIGLGAAAADNSLPGDTLYPLKLTVEDIREALANDEGTRASLSVELAERRNQELRSLEGMPDRITADFLNSLAVRTQKATELALPVNDKDQLAERINRLLDQQEETLNRISSTLPENAQPGLQKAILVTKTEKDNIEREETASTEDEQNDEKSGRRGEDPNATRGANPNRQDQASDNPPGEPTANPTDVPALAPTAERGKGVTPAKESDRSQPGSGNGGKQNGGKLNGSTPGNVKPGNPGNSDKQGDSKPGNSGSKQPQDSKPGGQGQGEQDSKQEGQVPKDTQDQRLGGQIPDSRGGRPNLER